MKRDPDFIVELLQKCEDRPDSSVYCPNKHSNDQEYLRKRHHLTIMRSAGSVECRGGKDNYFEITNAGHDFLAASKKPSAWKKTTAKLDEGAPLATIVGAIGSFF